MRCNGRFVVTFDRNAFTGDLQAAEADRECVAFGRLACLADRRDDPAPVCIFARYCCFTNGELAIERAIRCTLASLAPPTCMAMNLEAPSPSRTTRCANWRQRSVSAETKASAPASSKLHSGALPATPVAKASTVSDVEVSLSMVMHEMGVRLDAPRTLAGTQGQPPRQ